MKRFLALVLSACLGVCGLAFAGCSDKKDDNTIRLSEVTHSIFYAPLYIAINQGFFQDEGLTIELTNAGGADKVMTALTSKSADIGLMGPEATIYVNDKGKTDYPIIFGQLTKRDGSFLVGRHEEKNFDWNNIRGKRVLAGRPGGVPAMTLQYVVNNHGMTSPDDVHLDTDVAFDMMTAVFESDSSVDYTTMFEPTASEVVAAGKGYIVASVGRESGEVPYTAFSATKSYIDAHQSQIKGFLKALVRGYRYMIGTDVDEVAEALRPSFGTTAIASIKYALNSYIEIDAWSDTPVMTEESFNRLQDIMENAGTLSKRADYAKLVDNSYAQAVIAAL